MLLEVLIALVTRLVFLGQVVGGHPVAVIRIQPGDGALDINHLTAVLRNNSTDSVPALVSIRLESPGMASQRSHYRYLQPQEMVTWVIPYEVPDRSFRLMRVFVGRAAAMPNGAKPYPGFAEAAVERRFGLSPATDVRGPWEFGTSFPVLARRVLEARTVLDAAEDDARARLRRLLDWDRRAAPDFSARVLAQDTIGPYALSTMTIAGEPASNVTFLLVRRVDREDPLPTVVYLSGNPPGTKESGTAAAMILADAGLQVASIDRRESARWTDAGEFLANVADPVFDGRRLIDYLTTRSDVADGAVSVFGFSMGAHEAMFLAALHPRVRAAVLASRMIDHDSLFLSSAWAPTLWAPEVLADVGVSHLVGNWPALWDALTPELGRRAAVSYRRRFPFLDQLNPRAVLPLAVPRPLLIITGARDPQMPLGGVSAVDEAVEERYEAAGVAAATALYVMPRAGHALTPEALDRAALWLRLWGALASGER